MGLQQISTLLQRLKMRLGSGFSRLDIPSPGTLEVLRFRITAQMMNIPTYFEISSSSAAGAANRFRAITF
jgi:hypothetical protein